jgi:hypothetical protein
VRGHRLAAALHLGELAGGLLALLGELTQRRLQFVQPAGLLGADPVEGGGLVEVVAGVVGEEQRDGRVDAARAVLGSGQRTELLPQMRSWASRTSRRSASARSCAWSKAWVACSAC